MKTAKYVYKESCNKPENRTGLVGPFENFVKKMCAFLGADPDVTVLSDSEKQVINICVAGCSKPDAYRIFFPGQIFIPGIDGGVLLLINGHAKTYKTIPPDIDILKEMLANHPLVKDIYISKFEDESINRIFVILKNQTVQFKNDNWGSPWNVTTSTPEDLAKEVMSNDEIVILWTTESEMSLADLSPEEGGPFGIDKIKKFK